MNKEVLVRALVGIGCILLLAGFRPARFPRQPGLPSLGNSAAARAYARLSLGLMFRLAHWLFLKELKRLRPRGLVLDLGCGPGHLTLTLAHLFRGVRVIGIDCDLAMVEEARAIKTRLRITLPVSFHKGDGRSLPLPDKSVDLVVSTLSLHHWEEPEVVFREIHRVLKPGGRFLVFDVRRDAPLVCYLLLALTQPLLPGALRGLDEPVSSLRASYTPREVRLLLKGTGLAQWRVKTGPLWLFLLGEKAHRSPSLFANCSFLRKKPKKPVLSYRNKKTSKPCAAQVCGFLNGGYGRLNLLRLLAVGVAKLPRAIVFNIHSMKTKS